MKSVKKRPVQARRVPPGTKRPVRKTNNKRLTWVVFCLTGVAMLSAMAGALLAVSLASTPLMQRKLTTQEASVFNKGEIANSSLKMPGLTRPVNIWC